MRVLIVDDHEIVREGIRLMTEQVASVRVVGEASTGRQALSSARELEPDVILMDIDMPEMNGIEAIRRLRDELPHIRTLVLTVHEEEDPIYDAVQAGACGYLPKSSSMDQIREALEVVRAGGSYISADAASKTIRVLARRAQAVSDAARTDVAATKREGEVLILLADGLSARGIAARLGISERTVNTHIGHLYRRMGVRTRLEAVRQAMRLGLVGLPT